MSRNSKLAEVFHQLNFIESYGTGIRRIFSLYQNSEIQPAISVTPNSFNIMIPNMNAFENAGEEVHRQAQITKTPQMKTILDYLFDYGEITTKEVQNLLEIKRTRAYVITKQMVDAGLIKAIVRGENKKFIVIK